MIFSRSIRANAVWAFAGNAIYAACQWGMLVAIAQIGDVEMVGQFALALSICAPLFLFTNLQLITVQVTDSNLENSFRDYLGLRLTTTGIALALVVALVLLWNFEADTAAVIMLTAVIKAVDSISDIIFGDLQRRLRHDMMSVGWAVNGLVSFVALGLGLLLTKSLMIACMASLLGSIIALCAVNIPNLLKSSGNLSITCLVREFEPRWDWRRLLRLAWFAFPLGLSGMLLSLNVSIPRYFIEHAIGTSALGLFAAFAYFMVAGNTLVIALAQAAMPHLSALYAAGQHGAFDRLVVRLMSVGAAAGAVGLLGAILIGRQLLSFVYGPVYGQHNTVFVWLMAAAGLNYVGAFLGFAVNATRAYHRLLLPFVALSVFTILVSATLIPRYGLLGAAWGACAVSAASVAMSMFLLISIRRSHRLAGALV